MNTGDKDFLVKFLKKEEGVRREAYNDAVGYATTGVGHLIKPGEEHLLKKTLSDDEIDELLRQDIKAHQQGALKDLKVNVTENQMAALTSLAFNIGKNNKSLKKIVGLLNEGKSQEAADHFLRLDKAKKKGTNEYVALSGLTERREAERELFLTPDGQPFDLKDKKKASPPRNLLSEQKIPPSNSQGSTTAPQTPQQRTTKTS